MTETVLLFVIVALVALVGFMDWNNRKERRTLINALKAKSAEDMVNLELVDKTKIEVEPEKEGQMEDLTSLSALTDEEYETHVLNG